MVAEDEFAILYILLALDILLSPTLVVLIFIFCNEAKLYCPNLFGLGKPVFLGSLSFEIPIFPGLEKSLTFDFSVFGFSGKALSRSCDPRLGEMLGDFGNTTFAAA